MADDFNTKANFRKNLPPSGGLQTNTSTVSEELHTKFSDAPMIPLLHQIFRIFPAVGNLQTNTFAVSAELQTISSAVSEDLLP